MDIKNVVKFRKSSESIERKCAHLERCLSNKTSTRWRPAQSFRKGVIRSTCRRPNYCPTSRLSEHVTDGHNQVVARAARSRHGPYTCSPGASPGLNYWLLNWGPARQLCISRCWCSPQGSILNLDRLKLFLERGRERERETDWLLEDQGRDGNFDRCFTSNDNLWIWFKFEFKNILKRKWYNYDK